MVNSIKALIYELNVALHLKAWSRSRPHSEVYTLLIKHSYWLGTLCQQIPEIQAIGTEKLRSMCPHRKKAQDLVILPELNVWCASTCMYVSITHLLTVLVDVRVDLIQSAEHVKLCGVESGLFCQIGVHVLVTDGRHPVDVSIIPEMQTRHLASLAGPHWVNVQFFL